MITEYIKSLLGMVKKDDVLEDLRITQKKIEYLKNICSTATSGFVSKDKSADAVGVVLTKLTSKEYKSVSTDFYRYYKSRARVSKQLIPDIGVGLKTVDANLGYIETQLEQMLEAAAIKEGITAKKAILIRASEHLSFIADFTTDLVMFLASAEILEAKKDLIKSKSIPSEDIADHESMNLYLSKKINTNIINYAKLLTIYTMSPDDFKEQLDNIPDVIINDKTSASVMSVYGEKKVDPFATALTSGFSGNPIYHYRLIIADWQNQRYQLMKEKKKMLELKVMQLQLLNEKNPDPKLEKEIEYMENRISKMEFALHEMES